ncbi:serine hydrolase domain-containing protein [Muricoccus aerilatus]|uniref:serine hydrolase domain-containing protein n=1 Tax=Muricoccus aerilatus TaxID=452982 RepID=UPI0005C13E04|nr:serine hydrolase domain-containing protein [Roseomonas aerilata]
MRSFHGLHATCLALSVLTTPMMADAQTPSGVLGEEASRALDRQLTEIARTNRLPSVAVEVTIPGHAPYRFVTGAAEIGGADRQFDQPFRIASLTKTFVATAVLLLVDRGRLSVDMALSTWFPAFPNAKLITVDDLLRMRSGIAAPDDEQAGRAVYDQPLAPAPGLEQRMAEANRLQNQFRLPNEVGVYTNLNYDILGGIVERVSGQPLSRFIVENIILPMRLDQTSYPGVVDLPGGLHGYGLKQETGDFEDKTRLNPGLAGPAGAMTSSLGDLGRYVRALCTGALLRPATQAARMKGQVLEGTSTEYGQGLITGPAGCGHTGSIAGFNTDMYFFPDLDAAVIVSVSRLDRDDRPQSAPVLQAVYTALRSRASR